MSRGGAGREGSSPWGLGVAGGEVFQTSSRGRAGQRRHVGEEQGTNLEEQGRSRTGGRRSRTSGGRLGDEQGRDWRSRGGEDEEQRRSRTCREVARRRGPAARTTKSDSGTSEWRRAPFYSSCASVSWPRGKSSRSPIWRAKFAALALAPAYAPPSAPPRRTAPIPRRPAPRSATMAIVEATGFA